MRSTAALLLAAAALFGLAPVRAMELAVLPAAHSAASGPQPQQRQNFVLDVRLKLGISERIFSSNSSIISMRHVFVGSSNATFERTFRIATTISAAEFNKNFLSAIEYAQPESLLHAGFVSVNDPGFSTDSSNVDRQWGLLKAGFANAWDKTTGKSTTVIALIDTGIDGTHEDLSGGQVGPGYNFLQHTLIPLNVNSDDNGHGTLVAGIIAATPNNFKGISGTNWSVTLMPLKALDNNGAGNSADVAAAIVWAADHGANVINMSLGGIGFANDTTLSDAISYAFKKNVVLVAAAGNDVAVTGGNLDQNAVFPVCDDNGQNMIIGVAATDENDQKATFSNYGRACVDVTAPGKHILSTINFDPISHAASPNSYAYASGTSLAAPFVSGEAGLIKSLYPNATNKEIRDRILKSADKIDGLSPAGCGGGPCAGLIGSGRINAAAALNPNLVPSIADNSLVRPDNDLLQLYYVSGGQKQPVSAFVQNQRFQGIAPQTVPSYLLDVLLLGAPAMPLDGTLARGASSPTVYMTLRGFRRPITAQVFQQLNLSFSNVITLSDQEVASWVTSNFLPPREGTLVRGYKERTVYWVVDGLLHPINFQFWKERGLDIFPIMLVPDNDLKSYPLGNPYIR